MIHVVFQEADIQVLQEAIELDKSLQGEVVIIRDDFAVGPLDQIDTDEGWTERENWWRQLIQYSPYPDHLVGSFDDRRTLEGVKQKLNEQSKEKLWVWMGENQHDVCGYYWLISRLKEYQGRVFVLYLNNLPFINEKGHIFYPTALHQIPPREFLKAKKLNRAVTVSEFEVDSDEWSRLCNENAMVRILEGGKKIISKEAHFYDHHILNHLTNEWQKGNRFMHTLFGKMKIKTGDVYLLWRMKQLAEEGLVAINGEPANGWKEFEVKLKHPVEQILDTNS